MKNYLLKFIYLLLTLFFVISCDTPKSLTNKGNKFAEKKLYQEANVQYMKALNKKENFIDAKEGLRSSGQKEVNTYLDDFFKTKNFGDIKAAIYHYRNANKAKSLIESYKIDIDIPISYTNDYNNLVNDYVNNIYIKV